jgi:hypothetical protein
MAGELMMRSSEGSLLNKPHFELYVAECSSGKQDKDRAFKGSKNLAPQLNRVAVHLAVHADVVICPTDLFKFEFVCSQAPSRRGKQT